MKLIKRIQLEDAKRHEELINANVRIGGYYMDELCPVNKMELQTIEFEDADIERVFLLKEPTFEGLTKDNTFKLTDLILEKEQSPRVKSFDKIDLISTPNLEIILVGNNFHKNPLVVIDGNHRIISHYLKNLNISGLKAYLYIHDNISNWGMIPPLAKSN